MDTLRNYAVVEIVKMAVLSIRLEEEADLLARQRSCCSAAITVMIITTIKILISGQVAR